MGYLQLAESGEFRSLAETVIQNRDKYIFIPAGYRGSEKDLYVREDFFDGMPDADYQLMMLELAAYQNTGLSGKGADRRAARKAKRTDKKAANVATKDAKKDKRAARFSGLIDKVGGIVGGIVGGKEVVDITAGGGEFSVQTTPENEESWLSRNKIPVAIGAIVLIGGGIYLATRKKKK